MPKSRKRKRPAVKAAPPKLPGPPKKWFPRAIKFGSGLAAAIALAAAVVGLLFLWPRVTVDPEGPVDPSNPRQISFKITNTGFIPLKNAQPALGLCEIWFGPPKNLPERCEKSLGTRFRKPQWFVKTLARDESVKIRIDDLFNIQPPAEFGAADISIRVDFNPWIIPIQYAVEFRFQTRIETNGMLSWIPRPLDK